MLQATVLDYYLVDAIYSITMDLGNTDSYISEALWNKDVLISGDTCEVNIDDCFDGACQNEGTCVDGVNMYTCSCVAGYTGKVIRMGRGVDFTKCDKSQIS